MKKIHYTKCFVAFIFAASVASVLTVFVVLFLGGFILGFLALVFLGIDLAEVDVPYVNVGYIVILTVGTVVTFYSFQWSIESFLIPQIRNDGMPEPDDADNPVKSPENPKSQPDD